MRDSFWYQDRSLTTSFKFVGINSEHQATHAGRRTSFAPGKLPILHCLLLSSALYGVLCGFQQYDRYLNMEA